MQEGFSLVICFFLSDNNRNSNDQKSAAPVQLMFALRSIFQAILKATFWRNGRVGRPAQDMLLLNNSQMCCLIQIQPTSTIPLLPNLCIMPIRSLFSIFRRIAEAGAGDCRAPLWKPCETLPTPFSPGTHWEKLLSRGAPWAQPAKTQ